MFLISFPAAPTVTNLRDGTMVRTSVVILRGKADTATVAINGAVYPAVGGQFAGLAQLHPGANTVLLASGTAIKELKLRYVPARSRQRVQLVYILGQDEKPTYIGQTAVGNEADVRDRIVTMAQVLQAFTAQSFADDGYAAKTFTLATDSQGRPKVDFIRMPESGDDLRRLDGGQLYGLFSPRLDARYNPETTKILAMMGSTRYDVATRTAQAHTALGGGSLALFGSGALRFLPTSIADVPRAFLDGRYVDSKVEFDDSGNRQRAWANAATAYGACMHELGHAFGLPHSPERQSIMSRGFDLINRNWILREPRTGEAEPVVDPATRANWSTTWAARLNLSPWFQPDGARTPVGEPPSIDVKGGVVTIRATEGR
ncbi:MAG: hypothetical protein C4320_02100, partial [Armatimonadota bacterium]